MKLVQSSKFFLKIQSWLVLQVKFLHEIFHSSQFQKYNYNSTRSCNRKVWVDIPSYGPRTRFWKCRRQKRFGCTGEWRKSEFPRKHPWQSTVSEKVAVGAVIVFSYPVQNLTSSTNILQEFCLNFKEQYNPIWNVQNTYFTEILSITDSSWRVSCYGFCTVILQSI